MVPIKLDFELPFLAYVSMIHLWLMIPLSQRFQSFQIRYIMISVLQNCFPFIESSLTPHMQKFFLTDLIAEHLPEQCELRYVRQSDQHRTASMMNT